MLATALLAVSLLAPLGGGPLARGSRRVAPRSLFYAGLLFGAFFAQELAEALLDPALGQALASLAGPGALVAVPLALALGSLAALATRGLEDVEELLAAAQIEAVARPRGARSHASGPKAEPARRPVAGASLAFGFARRPPPSPLQA